jgi:hypothetical protein
MDLAYFKESLCDELDGAEEYVMNALEIKPMSPSMAKTFLEMSATELTHATNLYKMAEEYYSNLEKAYTNVPDHFKEIRNFIVEKYTKRYAEIKYMHELYNK